MAQITEITGTVEQTNDTGIKVNGNWLNYSKYGYRGPQGGQPAPQPGQAVVIKLKNDKFIHELHMGQVTQAVVQQPVQSAPAPAQATPAPTPIPAPTTTYPISVNGMQDKLISVTIEARLKILGTLAVAQPNLFTLDNGDTLIEIVRNLESFVLEDLIAKATPEADVDLDADDLLEEV